MTTASHGVAVIAAVAQTDRRALSEAWYSALHLASVDAPASRAVKHPAATTQRPQPVAARATARMSPQRAVVPLPSRASRPDAVRAVRTPGTSPPSNREISQRVERAVAALSARRPLPAAHTVDVGGGRVRLLVHDDGRSTRIVALCSQALREPVERALASARFALAGAR